MTLKQRSMQQVGPGSRWTGFKEMTKMILAGIETFEPRVHLDNNLTKFLSPEF